MVQVTPEFETINKPEVEKKPHLWDGVYSFLNQFELLAASPIYLEQPLHKLQFQV